MNACLDEIASNYPIVKICRVKSYEVNLSDKFVSAIIICINKRKGLKKEFL